MVGSLQVSSESEESSSHTGNVSLEAGGGVVEWWLGGGWGGSVGERAGAGGDWATGAGASWDWGSLSWGVGWGLGGLLGGFLSWLLSWLFGGLLGWLAGWLLGGGWLLITTGLNWGEIDGGTGLGALLLNGVGDGWTGVSKLSNDVYKIDEETYRSGLRPHRPS